VITQAERIKRRGFIGSSDIAAICGLSEFQNVSDIWLEKTGRLKDDDSANDAAEMGIDMEETIIQQLERALDRPLARHIWLDDGGHKCANLDAALLSDEAPKAILKEMPYQGAWFEAPAEAKSTGYKEEHWGDAIDAIPAYVNCQLHWQMDRIGEHCQYGVAGVIWPAFKRFRFQRYIVRRDQNFIDELNIAADWFWGYVERDERPPDSTPHLEAIKRIKREPASIISLDDEAGEAWAELEAAKLEAKHWATTVDQRKEVVLNMLGDAEGGRLPNGDTITFLEQNGARVIDLDLLQARWPEVYNTMVSQPRHRVLRKSKAKAKRR
jgi:YqaJ-like recombinase protein